MAEEYSASLGSVAVSWSAVGSTPVASGNASGLARVQIPSKTLLRALTLNLSGTWDQSIGAEAQATEGCSTLIEQIRLVLDGVTRRVFKGPVLYELNRAANGGARVRTDPAAGIAAAKAFAVSLDLDMGFMDADDTITKEDPREYRRTTYLDLSKYANVWLEVLFNPFSAYVSGNTQANMAATLAIFSQEILRAPGLSPQSHFEAQLVQVADMTTTGNDRRIPLNRNGLIIRGLLLRVGTLNATPKATAITALTNVGVDAKLKSGGKQTLKDKQAVAIYQQLVGQGRNNIALTAGYLFIDFASNRKRSSHLAGNQYDQLDLVYDVVGTPNAVMEVYQLVKAS